MVTIGIDMAHGAATALRLLQAKFSPWTGYFQVQRANACQLANGLEEFLPDPIV